MANKVFAGRDASIRVMDGTANTPFYVAASFIGDLSGPIGRARAEEVPQLDNGVANSKFHFINTTDAAIVSPVQITFGGKVHTTDTVDDLIDALSNPWDDATWQPGGTSTFVGVTIAGTVVNADGTSITLKPPADAHASAHLVTIEILWNGDTNWGLSYEGVFFNASDVEVDKGDESETTFSATGTVYGAITQIAAFSTPTAEIS